MFHLCPDHFYRVEEFERLPWLAHGFGTRRATPPEPLATLDQVHSAACVDAGGRTGKLGPGDALLSDTPGIQVGVRTADCIPILLADPVHRAVAAVHAGWRGTSQRIAARAVEAMQARFGTEPAEVVAAMGPGIGPCCYEVGPKVAAQFGASGRIHLDLPEANRRYLLEAGLKPERIWLSGLCTMCRAEDFHSFRRDGERAGRMYSVIGIV